MKTKAQIKERLETTQQLADQFYKDWNEKCDSVSYRIYRQYLEETITLKWVLEN